MCLQPAVLPPQAEFRPDERDAQQENQGVRDGDGIERAVQPEAARQQQRQRDQEHALPHQRDEQRTHRLADALEKGSGGHVQAVEEKGQHVNAENVGGTVQIQRVIRDKQHADLAGQCHKDHKADRRDDQRDPAGQHIGLMYALIVPRAEVKAVDGLHGGGDAHEHGMRDLIDLHHHAVDRQRDIAAEGAERAVLAHEVVHGDLHQRHHGLRQQAGDAQCKDPSGQRGGGAQIGFADAHRIHMAQITQEHAAGGRLSDCGGDTGAHHAHLQRENENRVENEIDDRAHDHALHRVLGGAVGADDGGERWAHQLEGHAARDHPQIGHGLFIGGGRCAAQHDQLRGEDAVDQRAQQTAAHNERQRMRNRAVSVLLFLAAEAQADVGGRAVAQQQRNRVDQNHQRKGDVGGGHAGDADALTDEDLIDDVVQIVDHEGQRGGDGIAPEQCGNRFGFQRVCLLCLHGWRPPCLSPPPGKRKQPRLALQRTQNPAVSCAFFGCEKAASAAGGFLLPSRPDCWPRDCTGLACARGL